MCTGTANYRIFISYWYLWDIFPLEVHFLIIIQGRSCCAYIINTRLPGTLDTLLALESDVVSRTQCSDCDYRARTWLEWENVANKQQKLLAHFSPRIYTLLIQSQLKIRVVTSCSLAQARSLVYCLILVSAVQQFRLGNLLFDIEVCQINKLILPQISNFLINKRGFM